MFTSMMRESSTTKSSIMNLPLLSEMHFSTLKSRHGLTSIMTPLLCEVP